MVGICLKFRELVKHFIHSSDDDFESDYESNDEYKDRETGRYKKKEK